MTKKRKYGLAGIVCLTIIVGGCGLANGENRDVNRDTKIETTVEQATLQGTEEIQREQATLQGTEEIQGEQATRQAVEESQTEKEKQAKQQANAEEVPALETLHFVDAHGKEYDTVIRDDVEKHDYQLDCFIHDGELLKYEGDDRYTYRIGVDVSYHAGELNWEKIKAEGISFAIIRLGARGYGKEGNIFLDKQFHNNIRNALAAGLDVGVYFFSQAINEEEAEEEAEFVLQNLEGYELQLPVVYDPESILDAEARTDHVTGEQFTKNSQRFCEKIKAAGREPMIYCNMLWQAFELDLSKLSEYPIWYADYEKLPQTPYRFSFWQYTEKGQLDAVHPIDLNIQLIPIK